MTYDFTIAGAGIIGLSVAYKLSLAYPGSTIRILEKEKNIALHQSGRNSGVIHSGIYYKPGSYRARNCVNGRHQLVRFCQEHDVTHQLCGKIITATEEDELPRLYKIFNRGLENGIEGINLIGKDEIHEIEPHCSGIEAIHVPCAGIVDFPGICNVLARLIRKKGGLIECNTPVEAVYQKKNHVEILASERRFQTGFFINCAGLYSDRLARSAGLHPPVQIVPFRGEYFELVPEMEYLVKGLIYPIPNPRFPFLGVHFTRMAMGGVECGPNAVFAFKREGYDKFSFDLEETIETFNFPGFWRLAFRHWRMGLDEYYRSFSKKAFAMELRRLIPEIRVDHLRESPAGVRAMALTPDGDILDDFHFEQTERQIHVLNAPSPAATACLSLADEIVNKVEMSFEF